MDYLIDFLVYPVDFFVDKATSGIPFCGLWFVPCFFYSFIISPFILILKIVRSIVE